MATITMPATPTLGMTDMMDTTDMAIMETARRKQADRISGR
jgi:hypothetical protein